MDVVDPVVIGGTVIGAIVVAGTVVAGTVVDASVVDGIVVGENSVEGTVEADVDFPTLDVAGAVDVTSRFTDEAEPPEPDAQAGNTAAAAPSKIVAPR